MTATQRDQGRFIPGIRPSPRIEIRPGERRSPATEFRPGERRSPKTEFVPGQPAPNHLSVGTVTIRTAKDTGVQRAWVKIAEPNVWRRRAVVVWESVNGPVPRGRVIHHKDRDSLNDAIENLASLTRAEHALEHSGDLRAWRSA